jgi:hypothetical protein
MSDKLVEIAERWKTAYEVWSRKDMQGHEIVTSTAVQLIKELSAAEAKLPCGHHVSMEQEVNDQKYCDFCYRLDCLQKAEARVRELEQWREKYFQIERAHSNAVDKIGELTARIMLRERELAERGADKSRAESKVKEIRAAYDRTSQEAHDAGLKKEELRAENASLREQVSRLEQWIARTTHGSEQKKRSNHAERMDLDQ